MKYLLFGLISFLFITACDKPDRFASLSEDASFVKTSQKPDEFVEEIKALVTEDVEVKKISGKERQKVNVINTVGENNLKKKKNNAVTHIDVTSKVMVTEEQSTEGVDEKSKTADDSKATVVEGTKKTGGNC